MERHAKAPSAIGSKGRFALACIATFSLAMLAATPPPASAAVFHPFLFKFGKDGTSSTHFENERALAVDQSSHDLYVSDEKIRRFTCSSSACKPDNFTAGSSAGTNKLPLGGSVAVAPPGALGGTAGDIYVAGGAKVSIFSSAGEPLGTIDGSGNPNPHSSEEGALRGVAVGPNGDLYLSYGQPYGQPGENARIEKYVPSANPVSNADFDSEITHAQDVSSLAVGSTALYGTGVAETHTPLTKYDLSLFPGKGGSDDVSAAGTQIATSNQQWAVNLDPASDDVYFAAAGEGVRQFDKEGNGLAVIDTPYEAHGVAIDGTSGHVYVSNCESYCAQNPPTNQVYVYGKGEVVNPPSAEIDPVGTFTYHSAHFSGKVNPGGTGEGQNTTYRFECSPACPGLQGNRTVPTDGVNHEVTDDSEGLEPETSYEVTLIAENLAGESKETTSFETPAKPIATAPLVTIDPVTTFSDHSAHLSGTVNPGGLGENQATSYRFEYSLDDSKWIALTDQGPIEGLGPQEVSGDLEGLEPNTAYFVRLRAENVGGTVFSEAPDPSFTTQAAAPLAEATAATHVVADSAQLNARLNPQNSATTYYFQWGTGDCASNPCTSVPLTQDAEAGSGNAYLFVNAQVSGLSAGTTYFYRLIAENAGGETATPSTSFTTAPAAAPCPNEALRSGPSANLPDCRAYEMVSPPEKGGGDVATLPFRTRVAADGNALTYTSTADFGDAGGSSPYGIEYLGSRGPDGWSTHSIFPHQSAPELPDIFSLSGYEGDPTPDLSKAIFIALAPVPGAGSPNVDGVANLYLGSNLRNGPPSFQLLSDSSAPLGNPLPPSDAPLIKLAGASSDLSHVLFEDTENRTPDASGIEGKLYESVNGNVRLAGILPDSACGSPPCVAPSSVAGAGATSQKAFGAGMYTQLSHAISADGSRVFFTAGALSNNGFSDAGLSGHVYMRENGTTTTQLDVSERTDCADHNPCKGTPESDPKGPGLAEFQFATPDGGEIYFLSKEELTNSDTDGSQASLYRYDVNAPAGQHLALIPTGSVVPSHVVGMSNDGSYLYFLGNDKGGRGLYLYRRGSLRKIAVDPGDINWGEQGTSIAAYASGSALRVSPDGRHVLFVSTNNQGLGYDQQGHSELFLYSADSDQLVCASCDPSGSPPTDYAEIFKSLFTGPPGDTSQQFQNSPMSGDGRYIFFDTADPLVPKDSNGQSDVYEYDSETGTLHLISSGQCNCPSLFLNASPDGHDVFFTTRQQLVRADTDNLVDMYDARIGGGIASQNAVAPAQCEGDACLAAPSPPLDPTPGSAGFSGPGNPAVHKKHKHHKRHHHKRSHKSHHRARAANSNRGGSK